MLFTSPLKCLLYSFNLSMSVFPCKQGELVGSGKDLIFFLSVSPVLAQGLEQSGVPRKREAESKMKPHSLATQDYLTFQPSEQLPPIS